MHQPDTLVILAPGFAQNETDSTCIPIQQAFVRALQQADPRLNIVILAFEYPFERQTYNWHGIEVIALGGKNRSRLHRLTTWIRAWRTLRLLKKQYQISGLLSFWFDECAFIGHYFARYHGLMHRSWLMGQDARPGNRYFKWIKPSAGSLIALSDSLRTEVHKNYGILPKQTISMGINIADFLPQTAKRDIDIIGVGSLISLKRFDVFIESVRAVSRYLPDVKAVICGIGPEKENLQTLVKQQGLEQNIVLLGEVPHATVIRLMQRSKVLLHTSVYEGFAAVFFEALYAGAHVLSFVKPMEQAITHHHIARDAEEMNFKLFELLLEPALDHTPVLIKPVEQAAAEIIALFAHNEAATSAILPAIALNERLAV